MTALADAVADLRPLLPVARELIAQPDAQGFAGHAQPASAPPWNSAAAAVHMDIHAGVRELERDLRHQVTGTITERGGSESNTYAAIDAIERLAEAVCETSVSDAARILTQLADAVLRLPAVDLEETPQRVRADCPYCKRPMLRVYPRSGRLTCLAFGSCTDSDGRHPVGQIGRSGLDGSPVIAWNDGLVT